MAPFCAIMLAPSVLPQFGNGMLAELGEGNKP